MENRKPKPNNTSSSMEVDMGSYGKVNFPNGPSKEEFLKALENRQINTGLVQTFRERIDDWLENEVYPKIEKNIQTYIQKISDARSSGDLKKIMNEIVNEGLVLTENSDGGKKVYYRKHPKIERTQAIITAYSKKKNELSKKYNEIISKPNGIRINGRKSPSKGDKRAGSYSLVLTVDFGENKHGQETVRITDFLPVHGPTPEFDSRTYIVGYSVPNWLKEKISEIKQKIKDSKDTIHRVSETETENKDEKEPAETKAAA